MQICLSMYDILVTTRHYKVHNHKEVYPLLKTFQKANNISGYKSIV